MLFLRGQQKINERLLCDHLFDGLADGLIDIDVERLARGAIGKQETIALVGYQYRVRRGVDDRFQLAPRHFHVQEEMRIRNRQRGLTRQRRCEANIRIGEIVRLLIGCPHHTVVSILMTQRDGE